MTTRITRIKGEKGDEITLADGGSGDYICTLRHDISDCLHVEDNERETIAYLFLYTHLTTHRQEMSGTRVVLRVEQSHTYRINDTKSVTITRPRQG